MNDNHEIITRDGRRHFEVRVMRQMRITTDLTPEEFIRCANDTAFGYFGLGLDSWDLGDATGAFIQHWSGYADEDDTIHHVNQDGTLGFVSMDFDDDGFQYSGLTEQEMKDAESIARPEGM